MARLLFLLLNLLVFVVGQGSVAPAITGSANPAASDCGGCFVQADVAAVVFGEEVISTATQVISVSVGKNGTRITTSFALPGAGEFTFNSGGLITAATQGSQAPFAIGTVITVNGATLTSPTSYNVFTAYSITSLVPSNGQCNTVPGQTSTLDSAYLVPIPPNADQNFIYEAEISFIRHIGGVTCAPGGVAVSTTTQTPVGVTTQMTTVTGPLRPTPVAQSTIASSTSAASATTEASTGTSTSAAAITASPSETVVSTISMANNATGTFIIAGNETSILTGSGPSATFVPFTGAADLVPLPTLAAAVGLVVPGVLAWLL